MIARAMRHLDWMRLNSKERAYQLQMGSKTLVSLTWQNIRDTYAIAEAQADRWIYMCVGYLSHQVLVQSPTGETLGVFKPGTDGGILHMTEGNLYKLSRVYPMRPDMVWLDASDRQLVHVKGDLGFDAKSGYVELAENLTFDQTRKTPLLISLGWYLLISAHVDMTLIL